MTEILHSPITPNNNNSSPSSCSSSPSTSSLSNAPPSSLTCAPPSSSTNNDLNDDFTLDKAERQQLSLLALLVTLLRKSCNRREEVFKAMEISWPTNVRHVAHVTFDRFNGFLGLPVEFEPEVPSRAPSASTSVFGVSTESMQLSFDSRGNSVPTILLLMQRRLYDLGGLQAEGIFRINAENSQEEFVREQLNRGLIPEGIDVHCLAGLIKAWLRELPTGVLDSLSPEQVMQSQTEEECIELVRCLPPTESALLDWAINLMADVVEHEHVNKMNARNVAMVFAPNMTQMADPLTALMYAVQVMNFLKTLILRTVREREDSIIEPNRVSRLEPFDDSGHQSPSRIDTEDADKGFESPVETCASNEPILESSGTSVQNNVIIADRKDLAEEKLISSEDQSCPAGLETPTDEIQTGAGKSKVGQSSTSAERKNRGKLNRQQSAEKTRGIRSLSSLDLRTERIEAWR